MTLVDPDIHYLYTILAFLMAAVGVVFIFRRMKASPVLGYLAAGMLVGPHVLQIIKDPTETQFLGEIGVIFLLFTLGLELPLQRLNSLKKYDIKEILNAFKKCFPDPCGPLTSLS